MHNIQGGVPNENQIGAAAAVAAAAAAAAAYTPRT